MKNIIYILLVFIIFQSCSTKEKAEVKNYSNFNDVAILLIESDNVTDNFTYYQNGLKVTYDFWGSTVLIILENTSDSVLFIDLNNSQVSTGAEKLNYNKMVKGSFKTLPLLPDSIVELQNFSTINRDNNYKIEYSINEVSNYKYKQKYFKRSECPISLSNTIKFTVNNGKSNKFTILNNFYSSKLYIVSETDFYELQQFNKELYNKVYYNKADYDTNSRNDLHWSNESKEIFKDVLYTVVELAFLVLLNY